MAMAVTALLIAAAQGAAQARPLPNPPSSFWVIGFDVEGRPAEPFLRDLATAAGGQFLLASDSASLQLAFQQAIVRPARPFTVPRRRGADPLKITGYVLLVVIDLALIFLVARRLGWIDRTRRWVR